MPRRIVSGGVYMVTRRCTQRQFLLRPDPTTTNAFVYCLALAAHRTQIQVVAFLAHSNHHHTIVVDTQGRMPEFLEYFHKLVAKRERQKLDMERSKSKKGPRSQRTPRFHRGLTDPTRDDSVLHGLEVVSALATPSLIAGKLLTRN